MLLIGWKRLIYKNDLKKFTDDKIAANFVSNRHFELFQKRDTVIRATDKYNLVYAKICIEMLLCEPKPIFSHF